MDLENVLERLKKMPKEREMPEPGFDCPNCEDRGYTATRNERGGVDYTPCKCLEVRKNRRRIERSGLSSLVDRCTFESYQTPEPWQEAAKMAAERYLLDWRGKWFFMGGTSGAGKTHLCTAICGKLMEGGVPVQYIQWRSDVPAIKASINDAEAYRRLMEPLKHIKALYIDDFLKGAVTEGDRNIAFDLLNYRYIDPEKVTIISSEMTLDKIQDWDVAIGGRIRERARDYSLNLVGKQNWRLSR